MLNFGVGSRRTLVGRRGLQACSLLAARYRRVEPGRTSAGITAWVGKATTFEFPGTFKRGSLHGLLAEECADKAHPCFSGRSHIEKTDLDCRQGTEFNRTRH